MRKIIFKIGNAIFPFIDFVYIMQLEEYGVSHYFSWIQKRWWKRNFQKVGKIIWTPKARVLFIASLVSYGALLISVLKFFKIYWHGILTGFIVTLLIPFIIIIADLIIYPIDFAIKMYFVHRAKNKLQNLTQCKIITIAGSYGKTTARLFLTSLLKDTYKIHTPKENINTIFGLAQDILQNLNADVQFYIIELGEYAPGDFKKFFQFIPVPKIAVLTSVGPQHLDTFQSQENIDKEFLSYLELTSASEQYLDGENVGVQRILKDYNGEVRMYYGNDLNEYLDPATQPEILKNSHAREHAALAARVAKSLGIDIQRIQKKLLELEPPERRLHLMRVNGYCIIDDSYNINPESAKSALKYLLTFSGKRKIVVTGGIVEQGKYFVKSNIEYGKWLGESADIIIVAKNNFYKFILEGIQMSQKNPQVIASLHPADTVNILQRILRPNDVVLVQNELPDLYWN